MSATRDPGKFFQTNDSIAEQKRRTLKSKNLNGQPIKLPSKVLALISDPGSKSVVYVAESSGLARRVDLSTHSTRHTFIGASAPLTCLALSASIATTAVHINSSPTLFAGCWDRTIWSWNTQTRDRGVQFRNGHRDFVKCLAWTMVGNLAVLISGSADTTIVLWDATSGAKLQVLQGHSMAVASLVVDPFLGEFDDEDAGKKSATSRPRTLFSASARSIHQWTLIHTPSNPLSKLTAAASPDVSGPITPSDGTIYNLYFPPVSNENPDPNLWVASADGSILSLDRQDEWNVDESLSTGEGHHVRAIAISEDGRFLAAAGRNEDVYVWDTRSGASMSEVKLLPKFDGHFDEVVSLTILGKGAETKVVSGSLDCTVRTWPMAFLFAPKDAGAEDLNYTNRIMAGNAFDNAALLAGGGDETVLTEGDPDTVAAQLGIQGEDFKEVHDLFDDDGDFYGD